MAMTVLWAAVLIAYGASTGAAMDSGSPRPRPLPTLDMAENSFDDMYDGCVEKMADKVAKEYLQKETEDELFKKDWNDGMELNKKYHEEHKILEVLEVFEATAVYAYTSVLHLYKPFNQAVRTQGLKHKTNFKYHALHFYLTRAVQKLRVSSCTTVYRRMTVTFHDVYVGKLLRFGTFTSCSKTSLESPKSPKKYGDVTCFEVVTCLGGEFSKYSEQKDEEEILIPPYEEFEVTGVKKKSEQKDLPCEVVYTLQSIKDRKPKPNFNCALI